MDSPLWVLRMVEERFHRDDEGRPLREGRTPAAYLRPGEIEYRPCPYAGSRQVPDNAMNVSALRQTSAHWDELIAALGLLRTAYAHARGSYGPDVMDLWRTSQLGSALPWFYVLRGEPLPAYAAALSKATLGTGILAQCLLRDSLTGQALPPVLTPPVVLALAESTGTLVGETEVCSAPDRMIERFLDAMLVAAPPGPLPAPLAPLVALCDRFLGFAAAYSGFKLAVWLYFQARRFLYADVLAVRDVAAVRALLDAPCEPPDFYLIEPGELAAVPPALRAAWLDQLATLIVPFAPDGSDRAIRDVARRMAAALASEADRDPIARAIATYATLDGLFGELVACVESGLRGARHDEPIDAAIRDRLVATSPRAALAQLGPRDRAVLS